MQRIQVGDIIQHHKLMTAESKPLSLPDDRHLTHLQFRRFAGCPFCSVHIGALLRRHEDIAAAGIREVVVFRATAAELQRHHAGTPFAVIADPEDRLYAEYAVGSSWGAILHARTLMMAVPSVLRMLPRLPGLPPWGKGVFGLPADFLIARDGQVVALKYGRHADDQWSVDELLAEAAMCAADGVGV